MTRGPHFWPRVVFGVLLVAVAWLTLTPNPDETEPGLAITRWLAEVLFRNESLGDKVAHFLVYALLGAAAVWANLSVFSRKWGVAIALACYGAALEGLQGLGGVRTPELADAVANGSGALAGLAAAAILMALARRMRPA
jgi:VanZ family protein